MTTLKELQELGAISGSLKEVSVAKSVSASQLLSMDDSEQSTFDGVVLVDNAKWVATVGAVPAEKANIVYSANDDIVGKWQREKRTFYKMSLNGDFLATVNTIHLKEGKIMPEISIDNMNLEDALQEQASKEMGVQRVSSFEDPATVAAATEKKATNAAYDEISRRLSNKDVQVVLPQAITRNNYLNGRLFGFVTATDSAVKLSAVKTQKRGADGIAMVKPDAPQEFKDKATKGERIPNSMCECEKTLEWRHAKPGTIKGVIIGTPAGTNIAFDFMNDIDHIVYDVANQDLKVYIMDKEVAFDYIMYNYAGVIKESKDVLGNKAGDVTVTAIAAMKKDGDVEVPTVRRKYRQDATRRKSLLTEDNYFPLKVYETVGVQDFTANAAVLNLNVEAVIKRNSADEISKESRDMYVVNDDGSCESKWFDGSTSITVKRYDDKNEDLADVRIPKREKAASKQDPNKFTYKFVQHAYNEAESGVRQNPKYLKLIKATGLEVDEFMDMLAKSVSKTKSKGTKSIKNAINYEDYLRGVYAGEPSVTGRSIKDIQAELDKVG